MAGIKDDNGTTRSTENNLLFRLLSIPFFTITSIFKRSIERSLTHSLTHSTPTYLRSTELANNFARNCRYMDAICSRNDARFISVLQPVNGIGCRPLTEKDSILTKILSETDFSENMSKMEFIKDYYSQVRRICADDEFFHDYTDVFLEEHGQIFFDTVHISDRGQEIIAESLCNLIMSRE